MFITQTLFELKKISKPLVAALFVLLVVTLAIPVGHELTQPTYGRSYNPENSILLSTTAKNSGKEELKQDLMTRMRVDRTFALHRLKIGAIKSGLLPSELKKERRIVNFYNKALPLLATNKFQKVNQLSSELLTSHPNPANYELAIWLLGSAMTSHVPSDKLFRTQQSAILKYAPTKIAAISVYSDALNLILPTIIGWGEYDTHSKPLAVTMVIWIIGIVLCASVFSNKRKTFTDSLARLTPLGDSRLYVSRALAALIVFEGIILLAYAAIILVTAMTPGHNLGVFNFPIIIFTNGDFASNPLILILAKALIYYTLWFIQLSGLTVILHQLTRNQITIVFWLVIVSFAQQLGILALFPASVAAYIPAYFINLPQLILHFAPFGSVGMVNFTAVTVFWTGAATIIAAVIKALQQKRAF